MCEMSPARSHGVCLLPLPLLAQVAAVAKQSLQHAAQEFTEASEQH